MSAREEDAEQPRDERVGAQFADQDRQRDRDGHDTDEHRARLGQALELARPHAPRQRVDDAEHLQQSARREEHSEQPDRDGHDALGPGEILRGADRVREDPRDAGLAGEVGGIGLGGRRGGSEPDDQRERVRDQEQEDAERERARQDDAAGRGVPLVGAEDGIDHRVVGPGRFELAEGLAGPLGELLLLGAGTPGRALDAALGLGCGFGRRLGDGIHDGAR